MTMKKWQERNYFLLPNLFLNISDYFFYPLFSSLLRPTTQWRYPIILWYLYIFYENKMSFSNDSQDIVPGFTGANIQNITTHSQSCCTVGFTYSSYPWLTPRSIHEKQVENLSPWHLESWTNKDMTLLRIIYTGNYKLQ